MGSIRWRVYSGFEGQGGGSVRSWNASQGVILRLQRGSGSQSDGEFYSGWGTGFFLSGLNSPDYLGG
jgi:hypothetical protein